MLKLTMLLLVFSTAVVVLGQEAPVVDIPPETSPAVKAEASSFYPIGGRVSIRLAVTSSKTDEIPVLSTNPDGLPAFPVSLRIKFPDGRNAKPALRYVLASPSAGHHEFSDLKMAPGEKTVLRVDLAAYFEMKAKGEYLLFVPKAGENGTENAMSSCSFRVLPFVSTHKKAKSMQLSRAASFRYQPETVRCHTEVHLGFVRPNEGKKQWYLCLTAPKAGRALQDLRREAQKPDFWKHENREKIRALLEKEAILRPGANSSSRYYFPLGKEATEINFVVIDTASNLWIGLKGGGFSSLVVFNWHMLEFALLVPWTKKELHLHEAHFAGRPMGTRIVFGGIKGGTLYNTRQSFTKMVVLAAKRIGPTCKSSTAAEKKTENGSE